MEHIPILQMENFLLVTIQVDMHDRLAGVAGGVAHGVPEHPVRPGQAEAHLTHGEAQMVADVARSRAAGSRRQPKPDELRLDRGGGQGQLALAAMPGGHRPTRE